MRVHAANRTRKEQANSIASTRCEGRILISSTPDLPLHLLTQHLLPVGATFPTCSVDAYFLISLHIHLLILHATTTNANISSLNVSARGKMIYESKNLSDKAPLKEIALTEMLLSQRNAPHVTAPFKTLLHRRQGK